MLPVRRTSFTTLEHDGNHEFNNINDEIMNVMEIMSIFNSYRKKLSCCLLLFIDEAL
jgi:hypothetical protein